MTEIFTIGASDRRGDSTLSNRVRSAQFGAARCGVGSADSAVTITRYDGGRWR